MQAAGVFYLIVLGGATINQIVLWRYALRDATIVAVDAPAVEVRSYFRRSWFLLASTILAALMCAVIPRLPVLAYMVLPSAAIWLAQFLRVSA